MTPTKSTLSESGESKVRSSIKTSYTSLSACLQSGETVRRRGLVFHAESDPRKSSHLEQSSPEKREVQVRRLFREFRRKQITDSCLCPRSDYRHLYWGSKKMHWLITYPSPFLGPSPQQASYWLLTPDGDSLFSSRRIVVFLVNQSLVFGTKESREGWDARWLSLKQLWKQTP